MDDEIIGIWQCSCCGNVFHTDIEKPSNYLTPDLYECALCVVVNEERHVAEFEV
ncbi:hypothetical protein [Shewanella baltica]|uniref:hypothetical protein n=1 Tax=Shewanella TaxID=22 RepID=UPI0030CC9437